MKYEDYLLIGGVCFHLYSMHIGEVRTYGAEGYILGAAVKRTSKNVYRVSIIWSNNTAVIDHCCGGIKEVRDYLKKYYKLEHDLLS